MQIFMKVEHAIIYRTVLGLTCYRLYCHLGTEGLFSEEHIPSKMMMEFTWWKLSLMDAKQEVHRFPATNQDASSVCFGH